MIRILHGDCRELLKTLAAESVHCCVTSPPYFGLRDYGVAGQIGVEATPDAYVQELVSVFRAVRRVLRQDGTLWLNLGDSYASSPPGNKTLGVSAKSGLHGVNGASGRYRQTLACGHATKRDTSKIQGIKAKDLIGIPWLVAFALRADGWWLRSHIIWHKLNPMPESVTDRPSSAHESIFLLAKSERYSFDAEAVREEANAAGGLRNMRNVWSVATQPYSKAHFATFPAALIEPCIKAGCPEGGTVLDPFFGAGTTGLVADRLGRGCIGIELNPAYSEMAHQRLRDDAPLFADVHSP
jgi:DNA modification methylase